MQYWTVEPGGILQHSTRSQADGFDPNEVPPTPAALAALCTCGHTRGDHFVNDGGCDVDTGCEAKCQSFEYSPGKNFEAAMNEGGTFADGTARNN